MKVNELIKWLELYDGNAEFKVSYCDSVFSPTILKKVGDDVIMCNEYGISKNADILIENTKNVVIAQGGKVTKL